MGSKSCIYVVMDELFDDVEDEVLLNVLDEAEVNDVLVEVDTVESD